MRGFSLTDPEITHTIGFVTPDAELVQAIVRAHKDGPPSTSTQNSTGLGEATAPTSARTRRYATMAMRRRATKLATALGLPERSAIPSV